MAFHARLWRIVDEAARDRALLASTCAPATAEQLIWLNIQFAEARDSLLAQPAFVAHASPGEAARLANWVVSRGRKTWLMAFENPASLPQAPADALDVAGELARLYRERYHEEIPDEEPEPPYNLATRPSDETELWELVDFAIGALPLSSMLVGRTRREIMRFITRLSAALYERAQSAWGPIPMAPTGSIGPTGSSARGERLTSAI